MQVDGGNKATETKKLPVPGGIGKELIKCGTGKLRKMQRKLYERCING
jgi:hypothetical protein